MTSDEEDGLSAVDVSFVGEGFAGFAWSTVNPQLVVAAVSQAYESTLVDAIGPTASYEGLFYSSDSGATWHLATITDGGGQRGAGPAETNLVAEWQRRDRRGLEPGAAAFYRRSALSRLLPVDRWHDLDANDSAARSGLTTMMCPTNAGTSGSIACPIYRGALAVNPQYRRHVCLDGGPEQPGPGTVAGSVRDQQRDVHQHEPSRLRKQWNTAALETKHAEGAATIANGDYNLTLAAVPVSSRTRWCWRARTIFGSAAWPWAAPGGIRPTPTTCMSAQVGEFQHALAWNAANPAGDFHWQRQRALALDGRHRRNRVGMLCRRIPRTSRT